MLKFTVNKDKSDKQFKVSECIIDDTRLSIIESKPSWYMSVFVKREVFNEDGTRGWYIEIWDHSPRNYTDAKRLAEKIYDITLWYKPIRWKE